VEANLFDFYQVMAYDAGQNYLYKIAMANYAQYVPKSKLVLGLTINSQWKEGGNFVEADDELAKRAVWAREEVYQGIFTWALGSNTQSRSFANQIAVINRFTEEKAAPKIDISVYTMSYADTSLVYLDGGKVSPTGDIPTLANVGYTLSGGGPFPAGVALSPVTGEVTIATTTDAQTAKSYSVTATPTGDGFAGTKTATAKITIGKKDIADYLWMYYHTQVAIAGAAGNDVIIVPSVR
jgi:hypothetical protein